MADGRIYLIHILWGGDTVAGDDGKRKEKGIPEKVPESSKKRTGDPGRDTKTPGR